MVLSGRNVRFPSCIRDGRKQRGRVAMKGDMLPSYNETKGRYGMEKLASDITLFVMFGLALAGFIMNRYKVPSRRCATVTVTKTMVLRNRERGY